MASHTHHKPSPPSPAPPRPRRSNPEGVLRQITVNDLPVGRSVDETLRLLKVSKAVRGAGAARRSTARRGTAQRGTAEEVLAAWAAWPGPTASPPAAH